MAAGLQWFIGGVDVSRFVDQRSATITQVLMHRGDTANFRLTDTSLALAVSQQDVVRVVDDLGNVKFLGLVNTVRTTIPATTYNQLEVICTDYSWFIQKAVGNKKYLGRTVDYIAKDLIATYVPNITTANVQSGLSVLPVFNVSHLYISDALDKLVRMGSSGTYLMWDVDQNADLHLYDSNHAPSSGILFTDDPTLIVSGYPINQQFQRGDFYYEKNSSQMSNRVIVRGGTYISNLYTQNAVGNGFQTSYPLDYTPQTDPNAQGMMPTVTVAGVSKVVALDTQSGFGSSDCLISLSQDSQTAVLRFAAAPVTGAAVIVSYVYNLPVIVSTSDAAAVSRYGTWVEYVVDTNILSQGSAARRAFGELGQFSRPIITAQLTTSHTYVGPLGVGQRVWLQVDQIGVSIELIVAKCSIKTLGGGKYTHTLECIAAEL